MRAGVYVPVPHVVAGTSALESAAESAGSSLPAGATDPGYLLARDTVVRAEQRGFELALFAERHLGPDLQAWMLAAAVAPQTSRITIMPAANPDFWLPTLLAKMAATLDRLAPGRSAINLVTGWNEAEQKYFSTVRHRDDDQKYQRAEEFVQTMKKLWTGEEITQGGFFGLSQVQAPLVPADGTIPIYTVSRSERGLQMAAAVGDFWFVDYGVEPEIPFDVVCQRIRDSMVAMRERADAYGRDLRYAISVFVLPEVDDATAVKRIAELRTREASRNRSLAPIRTGGLNVGLWGPPSKIEERVLELADLGLDLLLCRILPQDGEVDRVADAIGPALT